MKPRPSTATPDSASPISSVDDGEQAVRPANAPAVRQADLHAIVLTAGRDRSRPAKHRHAAAPEHVLDDHGRVGVLVRQHVLARRDQRDLRAQRLERGRELGAGHAGPDDDQLAWQFGQIVELPAGQQPLAVGSRVRQHPRLRSGRDQHGVRADLRAGDGHDALAGEQPAAVDHPHALRSQPLGHVGGLRLRERADSRIELRRVRLGVRPARRARRARLACGVLPGRLVIEPDTKVARALHRCHQAGGRDERLGGDAVREHARAAETALLDDRHVGAELRRDEGSLVSARPSADDRYAATRLTHDASFCPTGASRQLSASSRVDQPAQHACRRPGGLVR